MHILHLDPWGRVDFALPGHTVTRIELARYVTPLDMLLDGLDMPPDCIIQQEVLGAPRFLTGLEKAPCPAIYLACDTHLNLFWQQYYTRLFDAVLTPHPSLYGALPKERAHPQVLFFPHAGLPLAWKDHARREHTFVFCGRLAASRPLRTWMISLLRGHHGLEVINNISQSTMLDLYADTRIVPNEAICFELNLRLLEGASAGAAVLTPDCGPEQADVFTDGKEILIYHDGLDLLEKTAWLRKNPDKAERLGKSAWERVQQEHLPRHRALSFFERLPGIRKARATGAEAAALAWLALMERTMAGDAAYPVSYLLKRGLDMPDSPEMLAGMARLLASPGKRDSALALCHEMLARGLAADSPLGNAAYSALALMHGEYPLAMKFFARNAEKTRQLHAPLPKSPLALCLAWAKSERRHDRAVRPGFPYAPLKNHLPACALEFLLLGEHLADGSTPESASGPAAREKAALLAAYPAYAPYRLALLAHLAGTDGAWRNILDFGLCALFCCRTDEGLRAIAEAGDKATRQGDSDSFARALAASSSHAYIAAVL